LLYVAATRAREMVVISRAIEGRGYPAWGALNNFMTGHPELEIPPPVVAVQVVPLDCKIETQIAASNARTMAHERVSQASWAITSVTEGARHISGMIQAVESHADDPSKVVTADTSSHRADAGQAWGILIHGLLEHAMRQKDATADDLRRLGMWLTVEEPQLRDVLDLAVNTVLQVSKASFWDEARKSEHSVETPFAFAERRNAILTGVIDLLFGREEGWRILDYKTDLKSPEGVVSYQAQLKMYERAVATVGLKDVTSAIQPVRGAE
jgi:ATP-dependent helicase/nuclease subunit A